MAKGDTKTNQYLDIAANGTRADLPTDTCCETRSQTLIREVAERIMDVEDEVEELKNNPDVVDIVATYADLQAYDTQHLTDKDIIRVLQDETHDGESTYYRYNKQPDTWTYVGTVGDYYTKTAADAKFQDKLTAGSNITISDQNVISATDTTYSNFTGTDGTAAGTAGLVPAPATTDAGKFLKADGTWETVSAGSSYTAGDGIDISAQDVISATNTGKAKVLTTADYNWPTTGTKTAVALWLLPAGSYYAAPTVSVAAAAGLSAAIFNGSPDIIVMGNDEYGTKPIAIYIGSGKWKIFRVNNSGGAQDLGNTTLAQADISQSTGTSQTLVMSQNAVTSMVYADPSTRRQIRLGSNATSSGEDSIALGGSTTAQYAAQATAQSSIAIGNSAVASEKGAIALGDHSSATIQGQVSINTSYTGHGYNSSNYRLLTGLYDGQSAHDAATYGQLNTRLGGMSIVSITQTDYDNLDTKDPDTLYVIAGA